MEKVYGIGGEGLSYRKKGLGIGRRMKGYGEGLRYREEV